MTNEVFLEDREDYAMMALLMFYSFRWMNDLKLNNSYWKKYKKELTEYGDYVQHQKDKHDKHSKQLEQDAHEQQSNDDWPKERFLEKRVLIFFKIYRTEHTWRDN